NLGLHVGQAQGDGQRGLGKDAESEFGQYAQRAIGAADQLGQIEAGDVLHHLGAAAERFALAVDTAEGQQRIPRRAMAQPARTAGVGGRSPTQSGDAIGAEQPRPVGGIKTQALAFFRQHRGDLGQRRGRRGGDNQLGRLIFDDAGKTGDIQPRQIRHRLSDLAAGAARHDLERRFRLARGAHELDGLGFAGDLLHQKRGRWGWGNCAPWTWICPCSTQAERVGNTLPGLNRPCASKAHFTRPCSASSSGVNMSVIRSRFSTPTPCSPESTPPTLTHRRRMSAPNASARSNSPGFMMSKMIRGCRLPSPAWKTLQKPSSYLSESLAISSSTKGSAWRGMVPSMQIMSGASLPMAAKAALRPDQMRARCFSSVASTALPPHWVTISVTREMAWETSASTPSASTIRMAAEPSG